MQSQTMSLPEIDFAAVENDPVLERALYLAELDAIELRLTIPQAEASEPKWVY